MKILEKLGFEHAANYTNANDEPKCEKAHQKWKGKNLKRGDKVYCFIIGKHAREKIRYVGETIQTSRMFQYHKNKVMKKVRDELLKKICKNKTVQVWVCSDFSKAQKILVKKPFRIGRLGLEALLIDHFNPSWNLKRGKLVSLNSLQTK